MNAGGLSSEPTSSSYKASGRLYDTLPPHQLRLPPHPNAVLKSEGYLRSRLQHSRICSEQSLRGPGLTGLHASEPATSASQRIEQLTRKLAVHERTPSTAMTGLYGVLSGRQAEATESSTRQQTSNREQELLNLQNDIAETMEALSHRLQSLQSAQDTLTEEMTNVATAQESAMIRLTQRLGDVNERLVEMKNQQGKKWDAQDGKIEELQQIVEGLRADVHRDRHMSSMEESKALGTQQKIVEKLRMEMRDLVEGERKVIPLLCDELRHAKSALSEERDSRLAFEKRTEDDLASLRLAVESLAKRSTAENKNTEKELRQILSETCARLDGLRRGG